MPCCIILHSEKVLKVDPLISNNLSCSNMNEAMLEIYLQICIFNLYNKGFMKKMLRYQILCFPIVK